MALLETMRQIPRQLEQFRDRVYAASYLGGPKTRNDIFFYEDEDDVQPNTDDELPLFQVIKAMQQLINDGEWVKLFLARLRNSRLFNRRKATTNFSKSILLNHGNFI